MSARAIGWSTTGSNTPDNFTSIMCVRLPALNDEEEFDIVKRKSSESFRGNLLEPTENVCI